MPIYNDLSRRGRSPQMVVNSKGPIPSKMAEKIRLRIFFLIAQMETIHFPQFLG